MKYLHIILCSLFIITSFCFSQTVTQLVQGKVYDNVTTETLPFANIIVANSDPLIGTTSNMDGNFEFKLPVGRHTLKITMMGYETYVINELLVSTGRQVILDVAMQQAALEMEELVVRVNKDVPINTMTTVSSRQFTVEETQRYAGGLDDPARLASSFAGVATPAVSSNGISVRGNNPSGLLWRIEGVEAPNPNHFADLTVVGGGMLTALSNNMMGNSDFYTGAFPAEYGNATSGVFDINLKTGNTQKREYTFQAGVIGIDFAAEGPFQMGKEASYAMNYRYSTMGLVAPVLPDDAGLIKYQDLSFKANFPTKKTGTFSLWGVGALDGQEMQAADSTEWKSNFDRDNSQTELYMFAAGLTHKIAINSNTFLQTTVSATGNGLSHQEQRVDYHMQEHPQSNVNNDTWRYSFQTNMNKRFSKKHTNQTGFNYSQLGYQVDIKQSQGEGLQPASMAQQHGQAGLMQLYTQSKFTFGKKLSANIGVHSQYFMLNDHYSIEPRAGIKYNINDKNTVAFAYGLHSRIESLPIYFVDQNNSYPNKNLDLLQSTHYVLAYNRKIGENLRLCIEPYYQQLNNVPVSPDSYLSTINMQSDIFFNDVMISTGKGRNIGIDFTLERFLHKGFYYLVTASVFDAKYTAADGMERNTRFNKNYIVNVLAGKEWTLGKDKNNIFSTNIRFNYLGGNRQDVIDTQASMQNKNVVYGESNGVLAFAKQYRDVPVFSFSISYRKNKPTYSSVWSLQIINATNAQEYSNDLYNLKSGAVETRYKGVMLPNISYKIEF